VTFSDERFELNKRKLCRDLYETDLVNVHSYDKSTLPEDYKQKFSSYLNSNVRGAGYWTWKPWLVMQTLESCKQNDIVLWADAGCTYNPFAKKELINWFEVCHEKQFLGFQMQHLECAWTKRDVAFHLNCDTHDIMSTGQLQATIFLLKKCEDTMDLVNEWKQHTLISWMFDDSPSKITNYAQFNEHRHDQSVWSLLRKKNHTFAIDDNTWNEDWSNLKMKSVPIWATRKKT
jgi:hypothetical protein